MGEKKENRLVQSKGERGEIENSRSKKGKE